MLTRIISEPRTESRTMKIGDIVNLKAVNEIGIVVKQVPNLEKYPDTRFRIIGLNNGRDYEVQTSSKYWEVISESR